MATRHEQRYRLLEASASMDKTRRCSSTSTVKAIAYKGEKQLCVAFDWVGPTVFMCRGVCRIGLSALLLLFGVLLQLAHSAKWNERVWSYYHTMDRCSPSFRRSIRCRIGSFCSRPGNRDGGTRLNWLSDPFNAIFTRPLRLVLYPTWRNLPGWHTHRHILTHL